MTFTVVIPTVYGQILANRYDGNQTQFFLAAGKAVDHEDIVRVAQFIEPTMDVIDVGTCFGAWTLTFARRARIVHAFEAQRIVYNQLCGSLALNGIENVFTYNVAVGKERGVLEVPKYDYNKYLEFGSVYFGPQAKQGEMAQPAQPSRESVALVALDHYELSNIGVIKIDAEGMDFDVLLGAETTIARNRPVIFLEIFMLDRDKIVKFFEDRNYVFHDDTANMLALPSEKYAVRNQDGQIIVDKR